MGIAIVYTINKENEVIDEFKMDFNDAIAAYWGKRLPDGSRYYIGGEDSGCPFKRKKKKLLDVRSRKA